MAISTAVRPKGRPPVLQNSLMPSARGQASVKNALPQTAQNDPQQFPAYEYVEYPKMIKDKKTNKPFIDPETRQIAIVYNEEEEQEYLAYYENATVTVSRSVSADEVNAMEQENQELRARLAKFEGEGEAQETAQPKAQPRRDPVVRRARTLPDEQPPSAVVAPEEAEDGTGEALVQEEAEQPAPQPPPARVPIRTGNKPMTQPRRAADMPKDM